MNPPIRTVLSLALAFAAIGCSREAPPEEVVAVDRPSDWATAMPETAGVSNFFKVSDQLYRGAQPEDEGFAELGKLGIKTVVNLRSLHSDRDECEEAGLQYIPIDVQAWEGEDEEVIDFLKAVQDPSNQPVFLHCLHGSDRTGVMSAVYRIVIEGWSKEDAIKEMTEGGYGFHSMWQNLVDYVNELDVDEIKRLSDIENAS
ncbi:MAG: dual specificity protein phosphatase family protein [Acidobacteria bacterium]|uniref:Dual specificity protein phosphatase family protein n=1 Tax=Candidatus Polarisedimenticola svalbardensis TaxID=2886004 RepID=A0A8J7CDZ3_9BACT|nr:dual specificity protein phosphatase family protein [Candidatus Polarisedimenticola svalbardensis]